LCLIIWVDVDVDVQNWLYLTTMMLDHSFNRWLFTFHFRCMELFFIVNNSSCLHWCHSRHVRQSRCQRIHLHVYIPFTQSSLFPSSMYTDILVRLTITIDRCASRISMAMSTNIYQHKHHALGINPYNSSFSWLMQIDKTNCQWQWLTRTITIDFDWLIRSRFIAVWHRALLIDVYCIQ
jgi:hypothetical protein